MHSQTRSLRDALGQFATGVCVITTELADSTIFGMTVNSFSSVSLDPAMVLWSLAKSSSHYDKMIDAKRYTINVLSENQQDISCKYSGKDDRIVLPEHIDNSLLDFPSIIGAIAQFNCEVAHQYEGGDHIIIVGKVVHFKSTPSKKPLVFHAGGYRALAVK